MNRRSWRTNILNQDCSSEILATFSNNCSTNLALANRPWIAIHEGAWNGLTDVVDVDGGRRDESDDEQCLLTGPCQWQCQGGDQKRRSKSRQP